MLYQVNYDWNLGVAYKIYSHITRILGQIDDQDCPEIEIYDREKIHNKLKMRHK